MANSISLSEVIALAAQLQPVERRQLAESILRDFDTRSGNQTPRRLWREIRGSVPHPLGGEDAQGWVTRSRQKPTTIAKGSGG